MPPLYPSAPLEGSRSLVAPALILASALALGGCGSSGSSGAEPEPTPEPTPERAAIDDGSATIDWSAPPTAWQTFDGARYRLERRGAELALHVADEATGRGIYRADEIELVLREDAPGSYAVTHTARPSPPPGTHYEEAAYASCSRTLTELDGAPLRARRTRAGLDVEVAQLVLPARSFQRGAQRAQVVGCVGLDGEAAARRTLSLSPAPAP